MLDDQPPIEEICEDSVTETVVNGSLQYTPLLSEDNKRWHSFEDIAMEPHRKKLVPRNSIRSWLVGKLINGTATSCRTSEVSLRKVYSDMQQIVDKESVV